MTVHAEIARQVRDAWRIRTAHHEAAHAVAGAVAGLSIVGVTIRPRMHPRGGIVLGGALAHSRRGARENQRGAIMMMAGPASEARLVGRVRWAGARSDMRRALGLVDGDLAKVGQLYVVARKVINRHWPAVRLLARELIREGGADGNDVLRALRVTGGR